MVAVYIPEYVVGRWWENLLHNQSALWLKSRLLLHPRRHGHQRALATDRPRTPSPAEYRTAPPEASGAANPTPHSVQTIRARPDPDPPLNRPHAGRGGLISGGGRGVLAPRPLVPGLSAAAVGRLVP